MAKMDLSKSSLCLAAMLCALAFTDGAAGEDFFPRAADVRWVSFNFKTILTWGPKPSNYSYTVEFSQVGEDRQRNPHCIQSSATECDLTNDLGSLNTEYSADVLSGPLPGVPSDLVEFPHTTAPRFNPYKDTQIGAAQFHLEVLEDKSSVKVLISDPLTPLRRAGRLLTIRDVFQQDLQYKIVYRKAGSTGERTLISGESQVVVGNLGKGESYCFSIAAKIRSRSSQGQWTIQQCSPGRKNYIIQELSVGVLVGAFFIMATFLILLITLLVLCCRSCCTKQAKTVSKEDLAMTTV